MICELYRDLKKNNQTKSMYLLFIKKWLKAIKDIINIYVSHLNMLKTNYYINIHNLWYSI